MTNAYAAKATITTTFTLLSIALVVTLTSMSSVVAMMVGA